MPNNTFHAYKMGRVRAAHFEGEGGRSIHRMKELRSIFIIAATWLTVCLVAQAGESRREWKSVKSWVYQLCNYQNDRLDDIAAADFDLAVIDLARDGGTNYFTQEEIEAVKKAGKIVLAYFEIGAIEQYRPEWNDVPDDLKAGKVGGWPKEQYVKFWDERWWPVVKGRVDQALKAGFDGVDRKLLSGFPGTRPRAWPEGAISWCG